MASCVGGWVFLARRKRATDFMPQFPSVARTGSATYVCVVRNVGWLCVFAARQLDLGSAAPLMGALYGSCVYYTAIAWRLVWQRLTLDLSSPVPNLHTHLHTRRNILYMCVLQKKTSKAHCNVIMHDITAAYIKACIHAAHEHLQYIDVFSQWNHHFLDYLTKPINQKSNPT